jgi:hypothetical protein
MSRKTTCRPREISGLYSPEGAVSVDRHLNVVLINPLGAALKHYTASLERLLVDCGAIVTSVELMEPSTSGQSRPRWISEYVKTLRHEIRKKPDNDSRVIVIQTWPMLGYWDYVISKLILGNTLASMVLHDPHPLVRAVGYGRIARWIASQPPLTAAAIVHSNAASDVVRKNTSLRNIVELPLPMFPPQKPTKRENKAIVIRALGQYKADRDLRAMEQMAAQGSSEWSFEAIGRGWPPIAGWKVIDRFIEESEFEAYLQASSVIVIPYARFFQSDVAIRSLENGTPVVGPRASSLADLLGSESNWLVDGEAWTQAVEAAVQADPQEIYRVASSAYNNVLEQWRAWCRQQ